MKLQDLFERISAPVHINDEKTLVVIASLVEKHFGVGFTKIQGGCLTTQVIYSLIHAVPGLKAQDLANALNLSDLESNVYGLTLKQLFKFFKKPVELDDGRVLSFKLSASVHTPQNAMDEVKQGIPVICIPCSRLEDIINRMPKDGMHNGAGEIYVPDSIGEENVTNNKGSHAFMMIGFDQENFIWRETRNSYAFRGYVKIPFKNLVKFPNSVRYITVNVDDVKITQPKK